MTIKEKLEIMNEVRTQMEIMNLLLNSDQTADALKYKCSASNLIDLAKRLGFEIEYRLTWWKDNHRRYSFITANVNNKWVYVPIFDKTGYDKNVDDMYSHMNVMNRTGYMMDYANLKIAEKWN